jgi:hypothetical protein
MWDNFWAVVEDVTISIINGIIFENIDLSISCDALTRYSKSE